jgi:DNA invertase Pin-like site-specific DNA recombinase
MRSIAYIYHDPTWESPADVSTWGWEFSQIYEDVDPQRPQFHQLLSLVSTTPPDYLVLRRLEELGDSLLTVTERLTILEELGVCVVAIDQPYKSFTSGGDRTDKKPASPALPTEDSPVRTSQPALMTLLAEIQHQQRSRQIRHGHAQNRIKGLPPPGKAPYGYRRGKERYVVDRSATPVLRDFFENFLLYGSLRGAVRHIGKKHGKKISVSTGQRWLTNPVYRGNLVYHNGDVVSGTHMPLVSREEAAQVDRLLRRNRNVAPRSASAPRSLAGLVVCQQCQSPMLVARVTAHRNAYEYLYLRPKHCPLKGKCRAVPYEDVLKQTIQQICERLPQAVSGLQVPALSEAKQQLQSAIAEKEQVLVQLPELMERQILDEQTVTLRSYTLKTEISELQDRLSQLPPVNLLETSKTVSIVQFWLDLSETERRFYFREFIKAIEIVRPEGNRKQWSVHLKFIF